MRALNLDYQRKAAPSLGAGLAILLIGVAVAAAVMLEYWRLNEEVSGLEAKVAGAERAPIRHEVRVGRGHDRQMQETLKDAKGVLQELALPWDELFRALETAKAERVALLAIEPDARKGMVRITGEAKQPEAMLEYVRRLEQEDVLQDVFLVEHEIQQKDPEKPVRFALVATWLRKR